MLSQGGGTGTGHPAGVADSEARRERWPCGLGPLRGRGSGAAPPPAPSFLHPSPTPFSTAPAVGKGAGVRGRKVLFYGKGRKEAEEKRKREQKHGRQLSGRRCRAQLLGNPPLARPASGEPRRRRELALPAVTPRCRRRPWRPSPGAGAGADQAAVAAGASPPPCSAERDQARSRRFHAPGRGCARVALKEDRAAGECAAEDLWRRNPAPRLGRPELPGRAGAGQVATGRAEFRRPACGGSPGRRRVEGAGIPGLVSLRFAGAGSPQEPAGYEAGRGPAGKGLPAQPPGLRRATAVEGSARGSGPWGPPRGPRVGGDGGKGRGRGFSRALGRSG